MSQKPRPLSVIGYGMWTAAGHDGPSSVAAIQSGVAGNVEGRLWDSTGGTLMNVFQLSAHQWWEGETFLPEMVFNVLQQCHAQLADLGGMDPREIPILIATAPNNRPGRTASLGQTLIKGLQDKLGYELPQGSGVMGGGRCGIATLLRNAQTQVANHPIQIIIGAESFLQQVIVDHYISEGRLLCAANSSGFIPGEAAAAVIVARDGVLPGPALHIRGIGEGQEPETPSVENPAASGLTIAMRAALKEANTPMHDIGVLLADLNGEHTKFKEAAVANMRLDRLPPEGTSRRPQGHIEHWNVIETIGEVGAATIPAALATAFDAGCTGTLPLPHVMLHASEDDGTRIAIVGEFTP